MHNISFGKIKEKLVAYCPLEDIKNFLLEDSVIKLNLYRTMSDHQQIEKGQKKQHRYKKSKNSKGPRK